MIKSDEKRIRKLIKQNTKAKLAFEKMYEFFKIMDKIQATTHLILIDNIYIGNSSEISNFSLSELANTSERTCYRYREQYIDCFYLCFEMILGR